MKSKSQKPTPLKSFQASTGEVFKGEPLLKACGAVADFYVKNAWAIWHEDDYASHVTQEYKDEALNKQLEFATKVRRGDVDVCRGFSVKQRLNVELVDECVPLLP